VIDFEIPSEVEELRERVAAFVAAVVIPAEERDRTEHGADDALRADLQDAAKQAGLFAPQLSEELGRPRPQHAGRRGGSRGGRL
jgi:acyl-CoA dehydrogenase